MAKSEFEYEMIQVGVVYSELDKANASVTAKTDEGWEVQQIFTNTVGNGATFTFALLRRVRDVSTETYNFSGF